MAHRSRITPVWDHHEDDTASSFPEPIMALLRDGDPAFVHIARQLFAMRGAGIELNAENCALAIKLGRYAHSTEIKYVAEWEARQPPKVDVVYYLRCGEFIKIGTTCDIERRLADLLPDEVLAIEPGTYDLERKRHLQFADHRIGKREYFRPHDDLLAHIKQVRTEQGAPQVKYVPLAERIR